MNPARRLVLRRESLAELDGGQLRAVAGGTHVLTDCGCITGEMTCYRCLYCPLPSLPIDACPSLGEICWEIQDTTVC